MGGRVVQGLRGERQHYHAVRSGLVVGSDPVAIARALCRECDCRAVYVADLDALEGRGDQREVIRELREDLGAEPWVDAGVNDPETASQLLEAGAARVIVGTETLTDIGSLRAIRKTLSSAQMLVSVDVGDVGVLSRCSALSGQSPLAAIELLANEDVTEVILLALRQVGTGAGPDLETLRAVRDAFPELRLITGGGVRTAEDLLALAEAGADGVLLATALHRGWITAAHIRAAQLDDRPLTSGP
jgi:phosphoribosylformimino-5-aminoimidazole carboxamide ribotide isomerase